MKKSLAVLLIVCMLLCGLSQGVFAQVYRSGSYAYRIIGSNAIITYCDTKIEGNVVIPSELDGYMVTGIDPCAFMNCIGITHISIPSNVTLVEYGAFSGCINLKSVVFNNEYTQIREVSEGATAMQAFAYCTSLETIYGFANSTAETLAKEKGWDFVPIARVELNGTMLEFDVPPQIINGRTMVPMRKIFESLGADVTWNGETKTVTAKAEDTVIIMQIDNCTMSVNGEEITLDVPPQLVNDRTLVPIRAASEGLSAVVEWYDITKTVSITKDNIPLRREEKVLGFEDIVYTTKLPRMGDAFYNWSIDIPKSIPLTTLAGDGTYFEFSTSGMSKTVSLHIVDAGEATIETIKQSELDYVNNAYATLISQTVEITDDGVQFVRTVYEYEHYLLRYRGDSRMFLKDGYIYSLYTRCYADEERGLEYYKSIADSFSFTYDESLCEPLQRVEDGNRWYSDSKYKTGFYVPADWKITKMDNQLVFLSDELENSDSIGMIGFSVFSITESESLEEYVQKNKDAYFGLYAEFEEVYEQSDLTEIVIDEKSGIYYTDKVDLPDFDMYRKDIYFYIGDYVYNLSFTFKNYDASIIDTVINSFIAIELDKNEIGYLTPYPAG